VVLKIQEMMERFTGAANLLSVFCLFVLAPGVFNSFALISEKNTIPS
jgi:hypothetical protein